MLHAPLVLLMVAFGGEFRSIAWLVLWFGRYYKSTAETARKYFLDGAVVPFETLWMLLGV